MMNYASSIREENTVVNSPLHPSMYASPNMKKRFESDMMSVISIDDSKFNNKKNNKVGISKFAKESVFLSGFNNSGKLKI